MKKKEKFILTGIGLINIINGALLVLSPEIFKVLNICSDWFIGIYLTLNTLIIYFGSSIGSINKISLKINFNLITYLNLIIPSILLYLTFLLENKILLIIYVIIFAILQILRSISLNGITMLDKDNIELVKKKNIVSIITSILGLSIGQFILNINVNYFFIYIFIFIIIGLILLLKNNSKVLQKKFTKTKIESKKLIKIGFNLGIGRGCSLSLIAAINYLIVLNTDEYGYLKVIEALLSIIILNMISKYLKEKKPSLTKLLIFRTLILTSPLIILILLTFNISFGMMIIASIIISLITISEDTLLNVIFEKNDNKNINKYMLLSSSYYKICAIFLTISIVLFKFYNCENINFIITLIVVISIIMLINNFYLKKLNNQSK